MAEYPLAGKVALVTGAARGIGYETARALIARGASVVVSDLDETASVQAASRSTGRAHSASLRMCASAATSSRLSRAPWSTSAGST